MIPVFLASTPSTTRKQQSSSRDSTTPAAAASDVLWSRGNTPAQHRPHTAPPLTPPRTSAASPIRTSSRSTPATVLPIQPEFVRVGVRVHATQPANNCVSVSPTDLTVTVHHNHHHHHHHHHHHQSDDNSNSNTLRFDHVFGVDTSQGHVYKRSVAPLVAKFLKGYNAAVLAFGGTKTGKTYTMGMGGETPPSAQELGIVPRVLHDLFRFVENNRANKSIDVRCSYIEVEREDVKDLLADHHHNIPHLPRVKTPKIVIRDNAAGGIVIRGIRQHTVRSYDDGVRFLQRGSARRRHHAANVGDDSVNTAHAIFTVSLAYGDTSSQFYLTDLASTDGTTGKGLLALSNVINALASSSSSSTPHHHQHHRDHIPYRESKLTRLLQDAVGGNCYTLMMACVNGNNEAVDDALSTLQSIGLARHVRNHPQRNSTAAAVGGAAAVAATAASRSGRINKKSGGGKTPRPKTATSASSGGSVDNHEWIEQVRTVVTEMGDLEQKRNNVKRRVVELRERLTAAQQSQQQSEEEEDKEQLCASIMAAMKDNQREYEQVNEHIAVMRSEFMNIVTTANKENSLLTTASTTTTASTPSESSAAALAETERALMTARQDHQLDVVLLRQKERECQRLRERVAELEHMNEQLLLKSSSGGDHQEHRASALSRDAHTPDEPKATNAVRRSLFEQHPLPVAVPVSDRHVGAAHQWQQVVVEESQQIQQLREQLRTQHEENERMLLEQQQQPDATAMEENIEDDDDEAVEVTARRLSFDNGNNSSSSSTTSSLDGEHDNTAHDTPSSSRASRLQNELHMLLLTRQRLEKKRIMTAFSGNDYAMLMDLNARIVTLTAQLQDEEQQQQQRQQDYQPPGRQEVQGRLRLLKNRMVRAIN